VVVQRSYTLHKDRIGHKVNGFHVSNILKNECLRGLDGFYAAIIRVHSMIGNFPPSNDMKSIYIHISFLTAETNNYKSILKWKEPKR